MVGRKGKTHLLSECYLALPQAEYPLSPQLGPQPWSVKHPQRPGDHVQRLGQNV